MQMTWNSCSSSFCLYSNISPYTFCKIWTERAVEKRWSSLRFSPFHWGYMSSSLHKKALLGYNQHASFHGRSRNTLSVLQYSLFSGSRSPCFPFSCQLWHTSNVSVMFPPSADCPLAPSQVEITSYFTPLPVNACCTCATGRGDKRSTEGRGGRGPKDESSGTTHLFVIYAFPVSLSLTSLLFSGAQDIHAKGRISISMEQQGGRHLRRLNMIAFSRAKEGYRSVMQREEVVKMLFTVYDQPERHGVR